MDTSELGGPILIVFLLYFFFWPLCCLLQYTDSDYPFGTFKLFSDSVSTIRIRICSYTVVFLVFHFISWIARGKQSCLNFLDIKSNT